MGIFDTMLSHADTLVNALLLPLLGFFFFLDSKRRKEAAEASKAESENITQYAAQWKVLYEEKEEVVKELNAKIDQLYLEKREDRTEMNGLISKNQELSLKVQSLEFYRCEVRGCTNRKPPNELM